MVVGAQGLEVVVGVWAAVDYVVDLVGVGEAPRLGVDAYPLAAVEVAGEDAGDDLWPVAGQLGLAVGADPVRQSSPINRMPAAVPSVMDDEKKPSEALVSGEDETTEEMHVDIEGGSETSNPNGTTGYTGEGDVQLPSIPPKRP